MSTNEVTLDFQRGERIGFDEAIFCQGKTTEHLVDILETAQARNARLLLTRLTPSHFDSLPSGLKASIDFEPVSRTGYFGKPTPETGPARIAVVAAGTSDAHVTREVRRTLSWSGIPSTAVHDVGVAGLHRLLEKIELIRAHPIVICVAGMDAALPTVLGGLVGSVVIGVPTANGYGVAEGGHTALNAMLASCSPGIVILNIENGYGAACAAMRVLRAIDGVARH